MAAAVAAGRGEGAWLGGGCRGNLIGVEGAKALADGLDFVPALQRLLLLCVRTTMCSRAVPMLARCATCSVCTHQVTSVGGMRASLSVVCAAWRRASVISGQREIEQVDKKR